MCATCEACSTRCPNNIEVARVLDVCRHLSRRAGYKGVRNVRLFTDAFLQSVRWHGKSHELGLMVVYKLRSFRFFDDLTLAPGMLRKGKLPFKPHRIQAVDEVAGIFKRYEEGT
jgi:heterodisulfide reductase subunit C